MAFTCKKCGGTYEADYKQIPNDGICFPCRPDWKQYWSNADEAARKSNGRFKAQRVISKPQIPQVTPRNEDKNRV